MKSLPERAIREQTEIPVAIPSADGLGIIETIKVRVMALRDPETGEVFLDDEAMESVDKAKSRHLGILSPEEIKTLRLRFCFTQKQMSQLLRVGEKTFTRWEGGRSRPSQSMNLLLLGLRDGLISISWLHSHFNKSFNWEAIIPYQPRFKNTPVTIGAEERQPEYSTANEQFATAA